MTSTNKGESQEIEEMSFKFKVFDRETGERLKGNKNDFVVMTDTGGFMRVTFDGFYQSVCRLNMKRYEVKRR